MVEESGANGTPSYALAANCGSGFDPSQSMKLQALYEDFLAQGCKAVTIPVPPKPPGSPYHCAPTANTSTAPATGYACTD